MQARCSTVYSWLFQQSKAEKWSLFGESPVTGLCNQISAVYTFLPVAILFNVSLILAPLYSRSSFEITMREFDFATGGKIVLPYHEMFDMPSFLTLSSQLSVSVVNQNESLSNCILSNDEWNNKYIHNVQRTRWRSSTHEQILDMANKSGLFERRAIQPHGIIRIKSVSKMLGFYNFNWNTSSDLLLQVHQAIKPNVVIQHTIDHFQQILSSTYWVIHVRSEPDVFARGNVQSTVPKKSKTARIDKRKRNDAIKILSKHFNITNWEILLSGFDDVRSLDGNFYSQLSKIIAYIITSDCYKQWLAAKLPSLPSIHVASGLFTRQNSSRETIKPSGPGVVGAQVDRGAVILALLRRIGLTNIFTKASLYHSLDVNKTETIPLAELHPEQEAYVDLQLARHSTCFIPAHIPSTFSYMAGRMKELDHGQVIQKPQKNSLNSVYSQFIF